MGLHAFLSMPCGYRQGTDFATVREELVTPALALSGVNLLPADNNHQSNDRIRSDAIQKRLLADLVIIDLTSDEAATCYDRGLHHGLLARLILFIRGVREDLTTDEHDDTHDDTHDETHDDARQYATDGAPTLTYHLKAGRPDPDFLAADRRALAALMQSLIEDAETSSPYEDGANHQTLPNTPATTATPTLARRPNRYRQGALSIAAAPPGDWAAPGPIRQLVLFSGHMIDTPERAEARFPATMVPVAEAAITAKLEELAVGRHDLAICGGACGGDLLFADAALRRGCPVQLHLQYHEAAFLRASVAFAGEHWVDRYYAVRNHPLTRIRVQPDVLGPAAPGMNPYVRNNLWQLYTALACGADTLRFLALWDGQQQERANPGGTQDMVDSIRRHDGWVSILDTHRLFEQTPPTPKPRAETTSQVLT